MVSIIEVCCCPACYALIGIGIISELYMSYTVNRGTINLLGKLISHVGLLLERKRCIGSVSGENISSGIVRITCLINLACECLEFFEDGISVGAGEVAVSALGAVILAGCDDGRKRRKSILGYFQPAGGIGDVLGIVLGYFRYV